MSMSPNTPSHTSSPSDDSSSKDTPKGITGPENPNPAAGGFTSSDNCLNQLSQAQQEQLAHTISTRWREATQAVGELIKNGQEGWDYYLRNRPQGQQLSGQANTLKDSHTRRNAQKKGLRFGLIPRSVDSVRAFLHNAIFPADERFFRGSPRNQFAQKHRELYEQYRADNFAEDNTTEALRMFLLSLCIDDAACIALPWHTKTRTKVNYTPKFKIQVGNQPLSFPQLGLKAEVNHNHVEWEGTRVECLDFNDWRVDPTARSLEESWFIRRWYMPCHEVETQFNVKAPIPYHHAYDTHPPVESPHSMGGQNGLTLPIAKGQESAGKEQALLMVCYDDFVVGSGPSQKMYPNHMAVTLNGKELVWFGPNPYHHGKKPYIVTSMFPIPGQIYGMSLIRHAIPSAAIVDTVVDKILKIGALAADPIFEVAMSEPALRGDVEIRPGMKIPVKRTGAVKQIPVNITNLNVLMDVMQRAEENIREITGASPLFTGDDVSQMPSNVTAFQIDQHVQGTQTRFQAIINHFNNTVLEPLLAMAFENDRQFKTQPVELPELGTLTPDMIRQMDFKWIVTSAQANLNRARELTNLRALLLDIAPAMSQSGLLSLESNGLRLNVASAFRQLLIKSGLNDVDDLVHVQPTPMWPELDEVDRILEEAGLSWHSVDEESIGELITWETGVTLNPEALRQLIALKRHEEMAYFPIQPMIDAPQPDEGDML